MIHCLSVTALLPTLERTVFQLAQTSTPPVALILLMPWATGDTEALIARYWVEYITHTVDWKGFVASNEGLTNGLHCMSEVYTGRGSPNHGYCTPY